MRRNLLPAQSVQYVLRCNIYSLGGMQFNRKNQPAFSLLCSSFPRDTARGRGDTGTGARAGRRIPAIFKAD